MAEDTKQTYNPTRFAGDESSIEPLGKHLRSEDRLTPEEQEENAKADAEFQQAMAELTGGKRVNGNA